MQAQAVLAGLVVRACKDFSRSLVQTGDAASRERSRQYTATATKLTQALRAQAAYPGSYGLHAAANLVNAGITTADEAKMLFDELFTNPATVCR